jgi:hypothetical protein
MEDKSQRSGLIGVITCERDKHWLAACRDTWLRDVPPDFDVVIVDASFMPDNVLDSYENLPQKTKALCSYAIRHRYRWLLKIDNDCLARPRLFRPPYGHDYAGRLRGKSGVEYVPEGVENNCEFCSGGAYWLSHRAMQVIAQSPIKKDVAEDRWVGNTLHGFAIRGVHMPGYVAPTHTPVTDYYLNDENCVAVMQIESPEQMRRGYAGIRDPAKVPVGSSPDHYPPNHPMRTQMRHP